MRTSGVTIAIVATCLVSSAMIPDGQAGMTRQPEHLDVASEYWQADLQTLVRELRSRHPNLHHAVPREVFDRRVAQISAEIPSLPPTVRALRFVQLASMVGDGHTRVAPPAGFRRVPVQFDWVEDGYYVTAAADAALLGARLVRVGQTDVADAADRVMTTVPAGESPGFSRFLAARSLSVTDVLFGLGLSGQADRATYRLDLGSGRLVDVALDGASAGALPALTGLCPDTLPAPTTPALRATRTGRVWHIEFRHFLLDQPRAAFKSAVDALLQAMGPPWIPVVAIDLRANTGGDFTRSREYLLPHLQERLARGEFKAVFALIGPQTASAAMVTAVDLKVRLGAQLVGEPTGSRPNSYSEARFFSLPHTGLFVSVSTRRYEFWPTDEPGVPPDVSVPLTWDDARQCRDRAMEAVTARAEAVR